MKFDYCIFILLALFYANQDLIAQEILPKKREFILGGTPEQVAEALAYSEVRDSLFVFQIKYDNKIREYNVEDGAIINEFPININVTGFAGLTIHPTRNTLIGIFDVNNFVGGSGAYLKEYDPDTGMELLSFYLPEPGDATGITVHPITMNYLVMDANSNGGGFGGDIIHEYNQSGMRIGTWLDLATVNLFQDHGGMDFDPITGMFATLNGMLQVIEIDLESNVMGSIGEIDNPLEWFNGIAFSKRRNEVYVSWGGEHEPYRGNTRIFVYNREAVIVNPDLDFMETFDEPDLVTMDIIEGTYANLNHGLVEMVNMNPGSNVNENGNMLRFQNESKQGSTALLYKQNNPLQSSYPVLMKAQVWTDNPNVQIAIGCVDANENGEINDDAIGLQRYQNSSMVVGQWKTISALHHTQSGYFVPFLQATGNGALSHVYFDNVEVFVLHPLRSDLEEIILHIGE